MVRLDTFKANRLRWETILDESGQQSEGEGLIHFWSRLYSIGRWGQIDRAWWRTWVTSHDDSGQQCEGEGLIHFWSRLYSIGRWGQIDRAWWRTWVTSHDDRRGADPSPTTTTHTHTPTQTPHQQPTTTTHTRRQWPTGEGEHHPTTNNRAWWRTWVTSHDDSGQQCEGEELIHFWSRLYSIGRWGQIDRAWWRTWVTSHDDSGQHIGRWGQIDRAWWRAWVTSHDDSGLVTDTVSVAADSRSGKNRRNFGELRIYEKTRQENGLRLSTVSAREGKRVAIKCRLGGSVTEARANKCKSSTTDVKCEYKVRRQ
ncbi:hypothetical protein J6590_048919 [Homalodisca vitripennis]|nr:hypothetical protein J6590_048919 [Homalodisca vitripennis]